MGQAITSSQFYVYGRYVSTKTGYLKHVAQYTAKVQPCVYEPPSSTTSDGVSLSGLAVVVTGANSGIGLSVATYCAGKNATVYLLCRSAVRAGEAVESIKKAVGNPAADLRVVECDVGSMPSVRAAMAEVGRQQGGRPLHSVVCNAGVMNTKREVVDGLEQMLATHLVIGSYLLAKLADPLMDQKEGRVVFVSSGGMYNSKFPSWGIANSEPPTTYDGQMAYVFAKRGQVLLAERLTSDSGVKVVSCHPGWVDTPAVNAAYGESKKWLEPMRNGWEGAEGICHLVACSKSELVGGAFYLDREPQCKHIAGLFMTEGSATKNSPAEVDAMLEKLKGVTGI